MKIPITLGVIGHLDAFWQPAHKMLIIKALNRLHDCYPNSPLVLFSQLARGADLEVARVFLEHKERTGREYRLIVPLPFELERYKVDFDPESLACFERVLAQADEQFVVPGGGGTDRTNGFRMGGQFVADSSMVLLVFSDQKQNGGIGGTNDLMYYKIHGTYREQVDDRLFNLRGHVLLIPCDRGQAREVTEDELTEELIEDFLRIPDIEETLSKTDEINGFSDRSRRKIRATEDWEICVQGEDIWNSERLRDWHDLFANHSATHKAIYNRFVNGFFYLGAFLVGGSQLIGILGGFRLLSKGAVDFLKDYGGVMLLLVVMVLYLVAMVIKEYTKWKDHTIFIDDRVVAEAIRTQFFWKQSGIQEPVARYILRIHQQEHNWLPNILNAIYGLTTGNPERTCPWEKVRANWIEDQYRYFVQSIARYERKKLRYHWFYGAMVVLGLVGLVFLGTSIWGKDQLAGDQFDWIKALGIAFVNLAVGWLLVARGMFEKKGYDQMLAQYRMMTRIFGKTLHKMDEVTGQPGEDLDERLLNLMHLTGKEALIENGNWYLIFKERAPDIVVIPGTA